MRGPLNLSAYAFHLSGLINYELAFLNRRPLMAVKGNKGEEEVRGEGKECGGVEEEVERGMVKLCARGSGNIREQPE